MDLVLMGSTVPPNLVSSSQTLYLAQVSPTLTQLLVATANQDLIVSLKRLNLRIVILVTTALIT